MLESGMIIDGKYEITRILGVGGFGTVIKARHLKLDKFVAIKLLKTTLLKEADGLLRFEREAKAISALQHKGIVSFYGYGAWLAAPYIAMEFVEGRSLERIIESETVAPERALNIIIQVFEALDFAHRNGVVHRDLKPSNIMILDSPEAAEVVKIIDFGLAKLTSEYGIAGQKLTETGYALGTCHYMPPEQALGQPVDHRADIYATGCILQEMLTGCLPFDGPDNVAIMFKHIYDAPPALADKLSQSKQTDALQVLINNCIAKEVDQRYADGAEAAADGRLVANGQYDKICGPSKSQLSGGRQLGKRPPTAQASSVLPLVVATAVILLCYVGFNLANKSRNSSVPAGAASNSRELGETFLRKKGRFAATEKANIPTIEAILRLHQQDKQLLPKDAIFFATVVSNHYSIKGDHKKSEEYIKQAVNESTKENRIQTNFVLLAKLADAQLCQHKLLEAKDTLELGLAKRDLIEADSTTMGYWLGAMLLNTYLELGEMTKANNIAIWLRQGLNREHNYLFESLISLGNLELTRNNYSQAERDFQKALQVPYLDRSLALLCLARTNLYQKKFESATTYANRALMEARHRTKTKLSLTQSCNIILLATAAARRDSAAVSTYSQALHPGWPQDEALQLCVLANRDIAACLAQLRDAGYANVIPKVTEFANKASGYMLVQETKP